MVRCWLEDDLKPTLGFDVNLFIFVKMYTKVQRVSKVGGWYQAGVWFWSTRFSFKTRIWHISTLDIDLDIDAIFISNPNFTSVQYSAKSCAQCLIFVQMDKIVTTFLLLAFLKQRIIRAFALFLWFWSYNYLETSIVAATCILMLFILKLTILLSWWIAEV